MSAGGVVEDAIQNRWYDLLRVTRSWRLEWNLEQLLQRVAREAVEFLSADRGIIFLLDRSGVTRRAVWLKDQSESFDHTPGEIQKIAERVIQNGRAVFAHIVDRAAADAQHSQENVGDAYCVPLTAGRGILGALYVDSNSSVHRDKQNQKVLEMLGLQAAAALEHAILYHSAITDPLTGLYSHRHFQQEVEQAVRRALRSDQKLSLLILDLDHFKALNDSEGHEVGNQCLVQVAELLRATLRSADIIARFGGDEFELLLPDTALPDAVLVAEKIRGKIEAFRFGKNRGVAATIGAAAFPDNAVDAQKLFLRADEALYKAKEGGRNRTVACAEIEKLPKGELLRGAGLSSASAAAVPDQPEVNPNEELHAPLPDRSTTEQIDGYSLLRRLGMGSMGEVLLVRQDELDREVALKRPLTPHLTREQVDAFEREAKITASLNHPGVISVFALGRDSDGRRYYTMRPLNGMSLGEILERRRKDDLTITRNYALSRLLEVIQRVAETIAYAHQRDVFHLDLTPANVVLGEFGEVTVIDWGSSANSTTRAGINYHLRGRASPNGKFTFLVGSAGSLAPEQLPGSKRKPSAATDVHALGALLYEVLTGRGPYDRDNTHDVLNAIIEGTIISPEKAAPRAGIDPTLSLLCMSALQKDPQKRPSAAEFARRLGRYVRRETDFTVTRFGPNEHPMDMNEWHVEWGKWTLANGELVSGQYNNMILWKPSVPGAFRFAIEGWIEKQGEIAIVGRARTGEGIDPAYLFQFGAEWNTCTKLHRFTAIAGRVPEPGRRYRLEMEYQEGWIFCYIDGEKVFEHRELFHFAGDQVGFYTCDPGVHFKPIEIQSQNWGLTIPAVRMADAYFHSKDFQKAGEMYRELSERLGERLEGLESRLKLGICHGKLNQKAEAQAVFKSLRNTMLEPHALAEEAMLEYRKTPSDRPRQALRLLKQLAEKHADSSARYNLVHASFQSLSMKTFVEACTLSAEAKDLARNSAPLPTMMEINANVSYVVTVMWLGQWKRALDDALSFNQKLLPSQYDILGCRCHLLAAALANGREDLLNVNPIEMKRWEYADGQWPTVTPAFDVAVRQENLPEFVERAKDSNFAVRNFDLYTCEGAILYGHVALGEKRAACRHFERQFLPLSHAHFLAIALGALIDGQYHDELKEYVPRCKPAKDWERYVPGLLARSAVENRDFDGAARILSEIPAEKCDSTALLLKIMLGSLGVVKHSSKEMKAWVHARLAGTPRDLADMFLGVKKPVPGKLWPHAGWFPKWRLWLALWLEERGRKQAAQAIALPARDPRYGMTHAQPALEALLKRTRPTRATDLTTKTHRLKGGRK